MNCLIREKMFTYFYNKFRPVNHMHYIKWGVYISLHNSGCCRRSVAPWITVLSQRTVFTIGVIYKFTLVWYSTKQGTTHRHVSHLAHLCIVPFLWPREECRGQRSWVDDFAGHHVLLWLSSRKTFFYSESGVSNQNFNVGFVLGFDFFPAIAVDTYNGLPYLHSSLRPDTVAVTHYLLRYECLLRWHQNGSKATICLV